MTVVSAALKRPGLSALRARIALIARPRTPEPLPAHIDRRRVYILPTGFGLFMAVLLLAMLIGALNYNNNPALLMAFLLAALVHNSFYRAHLNLSGLSLLSVSADPAHAGQPLTLRCLVAASGKRPHPGLRISAGQSECTASLDAESRQTLTLELAAPTRGWQPIPRLRVDTRQPHGLAIAWCWFWPDSRLLVYPALEPHPPPLPGAQGERGQRWRLGQGEELHHLRDYRIGDPIREIAWKPSARHHQLLVREHETTRGADVALDYAELHGLDREARVRRLAAWVVEAERRGLRYRLRLPGGALGLGQGRDHRHACLKALAVMPHD